MTDAPQRFKTWLLRKTHALLGVSRLHAQMAQLSEELRSAHSATAELQRSTAEALQSLCRGFDPLANVGQAFQPDACQAGKPDLPHLPSPASAVTCEEALRALELQGLFILGAARSGTTILTRSLNRAREIILLEEPDFFQNHGIADFSAFFNHKHVSMGNRCMKGTYVAPPLSPEIGPLAMLARLGRDHRYVGAKTAIGPHDYPRGWQQMWLDFQSKYFLRGQYIYIMRTPVESLWSMHKLFPDRPVVRLFEAWLRAIALSLDAYHVFPNSRLVFFDDLGPSMIERLGEWLEVSIPCLAGTFGRRYVNSAVSAGEIPDVLRPFTNLCRECTELYLDLRESFSKENHVYCGSETEWHYFVARLHQIEDLLTRLRPDAADGDCQLRVAA